MFSSKWQERQATEKTIFPDCKAVPKLLTTLISDFVGIEETSCVSEDWQFTGIALRFHFTLLNAADIRHLKRRDEVDGSPVPFPQKADPLKIKNFTSVLILATQDFIRVIRCALNTMCTVVFWLLGLTDWNICTSLFTLFPYDRSRSPNRWKYCQLSSVVVWKHFSVIGRSWAILRFSDSRDTAIVSDHTKTRLLF